MAGFRGMPSWLVGWVALSTVIVIIDFSFVLSRPHSLPGGKWNWIFAPYNLYISIDHRYGDMEDSFGSAQTWLNVAECSIAIVGLILNHFRKPSALLVILVVQTMTFWKTVLYFVMYTRLANGDELGTDDPMLILFCFLIPNGCWVLFPGLVMWHICGDILKRINGGSHGKQN